MTTIELIEYGRLRKVGFSADQAASAARVNASFARAEARGDVALCVIPDQEPYDASYIDTWTDVSEIQREHFRRETHNRVFEEGTYGMVAKARKSCGELHEVESVWGFIGEDWKDSGYDVDMRRAALAALEESR